MVLRDYWDIICTSGLVEKEMWLQVAQANDALAELYHQLHVSAMLHNFKQVTIGGTSQGLSTKTQHIMQHFTHKTDHCATRYQVAYSALLQLSPEGEWKS